MKGIVSLTLDRAKRWIVIAGVGAAIPLNAPCAMCQAQQAEAAQRTAGNQARRESPESNGAVTPETSSGEIASAIRGLDDDRYAVRQASQRQLTTTGLPALELTAQVASNGSLESSTRALNILWKWADSRDHELNRAALEKIAELANRPIEAAEAQRRLAVLREVVAIETIIKLGGRVDADRSFGLVAGDGAPLQVIVGKEWTGGVEGLKHVADVRRATTLSLWSAPLDDEALPELERLGNLRRIELYGLALDADLVDKTREKLPNTMVEVRGPARLGIRGLDAIEIVPNSPAAKAGLVVHDRIVEFGGKKIETFEQLTAEIGKCKAGETVDIKFMRGAETREAKVTFDAWGEDVESHVVRPDAPPRNQGLFGPIPRAVPSRIEIERKPLGIPEPVDPALPR